MRQSSADREGFGIRSARWLGRLWAHISYARHVEPHWFEVNHLNVGMRDLPPEFGGFRIAHLSDFHFGGHLSENHIRKSVDLALECGPDVIALTGDFIHKGFGHVKEIGKQLARLKAPHGVFAVLGNHDFSVRNVLGYRRHPELHSAIADSLAVNGIRVLRNETAMLSRGGAGLALSGLDDLWSGECRPASALEGIELSMPRIVLAHNPQTVHMLDGHRCDLMLSGHTHGGQINLPGWGRIFLSPTVKRLAAGIYRVNDSSLYVNKGVGCGLRFRYGVRPEVALLTLHREGV